MKFDKKRKTKKMEHIFITRQLGVWYNALQFHKQSI